MASRQEPHPSWASRHLVEIRSKTGSLGQPEPKEARGPRAGGSCAAMPPPPPQTRGWSLVLSFRADLLPLLILSQKGRELPGTQPRVQLQGAPGIWGWEAPLLRGGSLGLQRRVSPRARKTGAGNRSREALESCRHNPPPRSQPPGQGDAVPCPEFRQPTPLPIPACSG